MKPIIFLGDSLARLRAFPEGSRRDAGFQLDRVQRGLVYVATFAEAVYVLHAFQKKTPRTSPRDLALAQARLRELRRGASR